MRRTIYVGAVVVGVLSMAVLAGAAQSSKKGVGAWYMANTETAMEDISVSASWFYTWRTYPDWTHHPSSMEFIPLMKNDSVVNSAEFDSVAKYDQTGILLGFNEPDHADQADMTPEEAIAAWPELEATGMRLGSPAMAGDPSASGSWLEEFLNGSGSYQPSVDFICVHWYGTNFDPDQAVSELQSFLQAAYDKFQKPIWLTEYGLMQYYPTPSYPSYEVQASFAEKSVAMLESLSFVERYAWFCLPPWEWGGVSPTLNLYYESGSPTPVGIAYRDAGSGTASPPSAPALSSPSDNATGVSTSPTLSWNSSSGATSYQVQVSSSSGFTSTVVDQTTTSTSASVSSLDNGTVYYWRVNASNDGGTSSWSSTWSFTTEEAVQNQAPSVNAGSDQSITLPSDASLAGSASDDGLPDGSSLTTTWSKASGPGTVSFGDASSLSTTAAFSVAGTYALRLTAGDGELSSTDDVQITVGEEPATNQPPSVNAGSDQSITLPSDASLAGSASDDGLPDGSSLTTTWSKASGPGTVSFGDASSLSTTAAFSVAGTYVLRLTAGDGELSSTDDVQITVGEEPATNQPPSVNAGSDQSITLPSDASLAGSASDDGLPDGSSLTTTWSKASGPGTVSFGDASSLSTTAAFSVAGTYALRLTAGDGELSSTDDVQITVGEEPATNQTPSVNAGGDQTITIGDGVELAGTASDDGLPSGQLDATWTMASGPAGGKAEFTDASSLSTTATFTKIGTYVLRLSVSDGELAATDELTVTVNEVPVGMLLAGRGVRVPAGISALEVYDMSGREVVRWVRGDGSRVHAAPTLRNLPLGTYMIQLHTGGGPVRRLTRHNAGM